MGLNDLYHNNIVIVGPTASGKTKLAITLFKKLNLPIFNFDSRQFYKKASILSCSPTLEERGQAPHNLYNILESEERPSLGNWIKELKKNPIRKILVGGTGFYVKSLQLGVPLVEISEETKKKTLEIKNKYEFLKQKIKINFHENDEYRVNRNLEFFLETGQTFDEYKYKYKESCFIIGIFPSIEEIHKNIKERTGLIFSEATDQLYKEGYDKNLETIIGYEECWDYINSIIKKEEAIIRIEEKTKRYAKRQLKFLKTMNVGLKIKNIDDLF